MEKVKLGNICKIINGYAFKSNLYTDIGIRIVRITNVQKGYIEDNEPKFYPLDSQKDLEKYQLYKEDLLISLTGNVGRVGLLQEEMLPAALNQRVGCIRVLNESRLNKKYLFYALNNDMFEKKCMNNSKGIAQKNLSTEWLKEYQINLPPIKEQERIIEELDKLQQIIDIRKKQIEELEELINSQFVEMFGDPILNNKNMDFAKMPSICEIIDGDRGKNYPRAEEFIDNGYCLFLNAKNVTNTGFSFQDCMYITKEKDEKLRNGKLKRGDIILTTRGTVGNLAFYTEDVPFENVRINSGMVILRMKKDIVNEIFFIEQFKMQLKSIKNKIANGSAQPQLPITKMNDIKVLTPNIKVQNHFAEFVKQIEKQKSKIQTNLKQIEELQASLMDKYF